jgi:hypothetical protein
MNLPKYKNVEGASGFVSLLTLLVFIFTALQLTWSKGVCCADDAYLSIIAKNLANGLGYASTVQPFVSQYTVQDYDPFVGTGPTIILLASLFIKTFGNTYWAPGLANVVLWGSLLILIGIFLRNYNKGFVFFLFTLSFVYLGFSMMVYHYEHWYALLGEVPAALLFILGIMSFLHRDTRSNQILSGAIFSLAVQSKLLVLIAILVFLGVQGLLYLQNRTDDYPDLLKKILIRFFYVGLGFVTPLAAFELWKLINLGRAGYIENWRTYLEYVGNDGARLGQSSVRELYRERSAILMARFSLILPNAGLMLLIGWFMTYKDEKLKRLLLILVSVVSVYSFWWVFLSIGWPRYFIISLIIMIFAVSLPLLSSRSKASVLLYATLIVFLSSGSWARLKYPFEGWNGEYFSPSSQTANLLETSEYLSRQVRPDEHIATEWWATAADIEYIMDTSQNFTTFRDKRLMREDSFWLVVNTRFVSKNDQEFARFIEGCRETEMKNNYWIAKCNP